MPSFAVARSQKGSLQRITFFPTRLGENTNLETIYRLMSFAMAVAGSIRQRDFSGF
jgi:hypothetical protein